MKGPWARLLAILGVNAVPLGGVEAYWAREAAAECKRVLEDERVGH